MTDIDDLPFSKAKQLGYTPKKRSPSKAGETKRQAKGRRDREQSADYKRNKGRAFIRDGMVCRCGCGSRDVTTHHIRKRSQGRDDETTNLITLDREVCHPDADAGRLTITPKTRKGADGPVTFTRDGKSWTG